MIYNGFDYHPFPEVGTKIRQWHGKENRNSWKNWGEVVAIVNGDVMIVLRSAPVGRKFYEMIDRIHWHVYQTSKSGAIYQVRAAR